MALVSMTLVSYPAPMADAVRELIDRGIDYDLIQKYVDYGRKKLRVKRTGRTNGARRDTQKNKTYRAEYNFERRNYTKIKPFGDIKAAQKRANQITKSKTWKKLVDENRLATYGVNVEYKSVKGRLVGYAWANNVVLTNNGLDEYTLLHEMAHCAGHMHHDVSFRQTLVKLVSRFMGRDLAKDLKAEFKKAKLPMNLNAKIQSFDQWYKGYERMRKAREARTAKTKPPRGLAARIEYERAMKEYNK